MEDAFEAHGQPGPQGRKCQADATMEIEAAVRVVPHAQTEVALAHGADRIFHRREHDAVADELPDHPRAAKMRCQQKDAQRSRPVDG